MLPAHNKFKFSVILSHFFIFRNSFVSFLLKMNLYYDNIYYVVLCKMSEGGDIYGKACSAYNVRSYCAYRFRTYEACA